MKDSGVLGGLSVLSFSSYDTSLASTVFGCIALYASILYLRRAQIRADTGENGPSKMFSFFRRKDEGGKSKKRTINFVYIRHGQSRAQLVTHSGDRHNDPTLNDCTLTPYGEKQAVKLGESYGKMDREDLKVGLVLVSPLTRCLQTACIVLDSGLLEQATGGEGIDFRIVVNPLLAEQGDIPENRGSTLERLKQSEHLTKYGCFKHFDFSMCESIWPNTPNARMSERTQEFTKWLGENYDVEGEEKLLYIFGHKDFGAEIMTVFEGIKNCSPITGQAVYNSRGKGKVTQT